VRVSAKQIDLRELIKETVPDINEEKLNKMEQLDIDSKRRIGINILAVLDMLWMNHLENMEALREAVGMRAYGQHEPLVEYRRESHLLFKNLFVNFENYVKENFDRIIEISNGKPAAQQQKESISSGSINKKIGRNDPCWCGSGKKYKKCHGK
jgi:preprotein translocase subunit SecA